MPRLSRGTSKVRIESVKPQHRILLLGTVTPVTVFRKDQPDLFGLLLDRLIWKPVDECFLTLTRRNHQDEADQSQR